MGFKRFEIKQKLQYLPFPDGIMYNKETDTVRTGRVNALFVETSVLTELLKKKPNDNFEENYHLASSVGMTRFELATPRPPDVCATGLRYIPKHDS